MGSALIIVFGVLWAAGWVLGARLGRRCAGGQGPFSERSGGGHADFTHRFSTHRESPLSPIAGLDRPDGSAFPGTSFPAPAGPPGGRSLPEPPLPGGLTAADTCDLSIIIPARNEEHNLPQLLGSIFGEGESLGENARQVSAETERSRDGRAPRQPGRLSSLDLPHEVLVVDDGSTDRTAELAREAGARVITSQPLPDGWRGKTWACHQGALAAAGEWLLFMDADTWLEPDGLARLMGAAGTGALSVLPFHAVRRPYEDLSLFFNIGMAAGTIPDGLSGQVLLVRRGDYRRIGGHEAVRGEVLENFRLAARFREAGVAVACLPGKGMVSFRMYPVGLGELVAGWMKGFAAGAGGTAPAALALVIAWFTGLMLPPLLGALTGQWWMAVAAFALCAAQVCWLARRLGSFGWLACLCYPVPLLFFFGLFGVAALRKGKKAKWKGREFDVP